MTKKKFTPEATLVVQLHAGTTYDIIEEGGMCYIPAFPSVGAAASSETTKAPVATGKAEESDNGTTSTRRGRGAAKAEAEEKLTTPSKDDKPATGRGRRGAATQAPADGDNKEDVKAIFEKLEAGADLPEADAKKQLVKLAENDVQKEAFLNAFNTFVKNPELSVDEALAIAFEEEPTSKRSAAPKAASKPVKKKELTEDDVEVGDRVLVHWKETEDYEASDYEGEVTGKGRKGLMITYDGEEEATKFDPEFHQLKEILKD